MDIGLVLYLFNAKLGRFCVDTNRYFVAFEMENRLRKTNAAKTCFVFKVSRIRQCLCVCVCVCECVCVCVCERERERESISS